MPFLFLCIQNRIMQLSPHEVSPFGHLRIKGCLPPPRSLSQAATSFIGTFCLAILRMLLLDALQPFINLNSCPWFSYYYYFIFCCNDRLNPIGRIGAILRIRETVEKLDEMSVRGSRRALRSQQFGFEALRRDGCCSLTNRPSPKAIL